MKEYMKLLGSVTLCALLLITMLSLLGFFIGLAYTIPTIGIPLLILVAIIAVTTGLYIENRNGK